MRNSKLRLRGKLFFCRNLDDSMHIFPSYERNISDWFSIENDKVFIDVGAHIGRYTILIASECKKVISIEPHPSNIRILSLNVRLNNLTNVVVFPVACLSYNSYVRLYESERTGWHSIYDGDNKEKYITVEAMRLDDIVGLSRTQWKDVGLVKIDVEGAELEVLKGAENLITRGQPVLIIESTSHRKEVEDLLRGLNYELVAQDVCSPNFLFKKRQGIED